MTQRTHPDTVLCIANDGNEASLQLWKIYRALDDDIARDEGFVRVIDESGEDYLLPEENFARIELPAAAREPFDRATRPQPQPRRTMRIAESPDPLPPRTKRR